MFNIKEEKTENVINIAIEGILDSKTSPELQKIIKKIDSDVKEINFDFTNVEYLTSAGLRAILFARQLMDDSDGKMTLRGVNDDIKDIFKVTGFIDVLDLID